ncbi:TolC family outer membrane protein [Sulfurimonas sp.]|nr:TolC family outer membrane protein [Sulfurimonas sp.]
MNKLILSIILVNSLFSQDLKTTIEEVLITNPIILERLKNYNVTKEDIEIAQSDYFPKLDLSLGVGQENGNSATGVDFDYSVYQNSLTLTQNVFRGFETKYRVAQQDERTIAAAYSYVEKVNDTSFKMLDYYLQVMKNKELLDITQENIDINEEILNKVNKLYDAGLTTLSEVNKIESALSLAKSNYIVQENTLLDVTYSMQRVLGRYLDPKLMTRPSLQVEFPLSIEEAAQYAMQHNPSLLVSTHNIKLAQATHKEKKSPFYPSIDLEVSQSYNKNLSGVEGKFDNFKAMAYLRYNIFNGFADSAAIQKSVSAIHQEVEIKNRLRREVLEGLNLSWAANEKLSTQLGHLKEYKKFSMKTLMLFTKEYDLGRRSLLDLLSAQNDFIGSKSQIVNTEYSILFAKFRILDAMGTLVSTVVGEDYNSPANVGLHAETPENVDALPLTYDRDKDLIVDEEDLCNNSLSTDTRNIFGCAKKYTNIKQIERYSGFLFEDSEDTLTSYGLDRLEKLIKQIETYGWENIEIDIFGHVDSIYMSEAEMVSLSTSRAKAAKEILISSGAHSQSIEIYSKANTAPMFSGTDSESTEQNNRVDIVIKKLIINK